MPEPAPAKQILVVDDEEDVQFLIRRILRDSGYEVESAGDGAEALEKIAARRPDLVVLDLMMPGMDGWGVLKRLRETSEPPPVVIVTALTDYQAFTRGVREGAAAFVCKPFHFAELVVTCQKVIAGGGVPAPRAVERRREQRRQLMVEVRVLSQEKRPIALGELVNLSAGGAQVDLGVPVEVGEGVRVAFHVAGAGSTLTLEGRVRWREARSKGYAHGLALSALTAEEERQLRELLGPA